ncbi:type VI secretion system-associated FHA domain protein TagH [Stenotrophomonas sp. SY1]|uniref:type VI secretion system-associated FHA domain protein TagH n=1 Tax=Stenotrophomonas sp. SY1 TaxID=477235 RepID=UPI001E5CC21D|nr:type VI secretion system-associated FHA domain protein TagH [Stenotrophomonas sp. SY1]
MSLLQNLILTVSGRQASQFGNAAQKTFVQHGGSIGRADECDWVLPASGVSRTHAMVRYLNGMYFVEDCSTNGMLLNGSGLARGEPAMLGDGDRLQVDSFEIEVRLQTIGAPPASLPSADMANPDLTQVAITPPQRSAADQALPMDDPFDQLWGGAPFATPVAAAPAPGFVEPMPAQAPAELDPMRLLQPAQPAPVAPLRGEAGGWNHSHATQDHFRPPQVSGGGNHLPEDWDLTSGDFAPPPATAMPPMPTPHVTAAPTALAEAERERILHVVTEGVMEVLRARSEIKNTFRLPVTVIQRSENNPLKFAATTEDALHRIGAAPGGAFLTGAAAFDDAFDDIRGHQMAMLAGMRAGYEAVLRHFDPDRLEQDVDRSGRRLGFSGRGRYWERYREQFEASARDPDDCFRRLFGEEFARAYESQLARCKRVR